MSEYGSFTLKFFEWLADRVASASFKDGQEPTVASQRAEAREADARAKSEKPRALTTHDRKAIDKEFWDSM